MSEALFTAALGLSAPWRVTDIRFAPAAGEIHFDIGCASSRLSCPVCGAADQAIHDRREHTWQHLHFFQYRAFIHAQLPRVRCGVCGKTTQVSVPWARPGSGFTLLFEALVLTLAQAMPVTQVARVLGVNDARLWRVLDAIVGTARAEESHAGVGRIGVDEKHIGRLGFISLFHDAQTRRVLFGRPARTLPCSKPSPRTCGLTAAIRRRSTRCRWICPRRSRPARRNICHRQRSASTAST